MKHECPARVRLRVEVLDRAIEARNPRDPSKRVRITAYSSFEGVIEMIDNVEWLMIDHLRPFGIRLRSPQLGMLPIPKGERAPRQASNLPAQDLFSLSEDLKIEVWQIEGDTRKEFF